MKKIQWVTVYSPLLEETKEDIVVITHGHTHMGALLFRHDEHDEIKEVIKEVTLEEDVSNEDFLDAIVEMYLNNTKKKYDSTEGTIRHWFLMNGVGSKPLGKEHYSKLVKVGTRTFRYNKKHAMLEWYQESNDEVIASIGLSRENANESLEYWAERYSEELDEEHEANMAEFR